MKKAAPKELKTFEKEAVKLFEQSCDNFLEIFRTFKELRQEAGSAAEFISGASTFLPREEAIMWHRVIQVADEMSEEDFLVYARRSTFEVRDLANYIEIPITLLDAYFDLENALCDGARAINSENPNLVDQTTSVKTFLILMGLKRPGPVEIQ